MNDDIEGVQTPAYYFSKEELQELFQEFIQIKQVIAGQPINRGGSRCTFECDIENHHIHTYCTMCKKNLPYGTILHDCIIGFTLGKIRPDMKPEFLVNQPWWEEPEGVKQTNLVHYLKCFLRLSYGLPPYTISTEPFVASLD